jgi:A/G-specific adenine glycosylase
MNKSIVSPLLNWYQENKKSWPWRDNPEPYQVWISEIMAQQTRLSTVLPYFQKWMELFPTIYELADATEQQVLLVWEGLGYYARARNIHKAANQIVSDFNGKLPNNAEELITLPGIGKYTAGAIASIAFGKNSAVVDGNVKRVIARVFHVSTEINTPSGEKEIWEIAEGLIPNGQAGDFNQAIMELGAFICKPTSPKCDICPVNEACIAKRKGVELEFPKKKLASKIPHISVSAAIITRNDKFLIAQRPSKGLLAGLWEFPGGKLEKGESEELALIREINEELGITIGLGEKLGVYKHAYSHFKVTLHAFMVNSYKKQPKGLEGQTIKWVRIEQLKKFPMGKIDRDISNTLLEYAKKQS